VANCSKMSSGPLRGLFNSIARCPKVREIYDGGGGGGCGRIVRYQISERAAVRYEDFQVPEPWVGQIDVAPILFISSNPSIGDDDHSCFDTSEEIIWESHHLAYGGGTRPYIIDGIYPTDRDGNRLQAQKYWSWVRGRVAELIPQRALRDGIDYALTEVVHCKSSGQYGVKEAAPVCADLYLPKVLSVAAARLVVAVGVIAQHKIFGLAVPPTHPIEMEMGGRTRTIVALPHPNSNKKKTFAGRYTPEDVDRLRAVITC
jgi:hypothetical protein